MLEMKKKTTITGKSVIDGVAVEGYSASIDSENPENMTLSSWQERKDLYKVNRETCRKDAADFEDAAYAIQDKMIAEMVTEG